MNAGLDWIPLGTVFSLKDMVFWSGKGSISFEEAAGGIDTVVLGPHASARIPSELQDFVARELTRRKQYDFSDVITGALGRAWAAADPGVVFVENPHPRLVLDPNRAPPGDVMPGLREFFARLRRQRAGEAVSFAGVDAVRPTTFSGEAVLEEPQDDAGWHSLSAAIEAARRLGPDAYRKACDHILETVLRVRPPGTPLLVVSLHDTMNTKMGADGAVVVERPPADRLPELVNFGNRGDARGERESDPLTMAPGRLRQIADAWAAAFGVQGGARERTITLNQPFKGAYETVHYGAKLMARGEPLTGAFQVEFLREALLGPRAVAELYRLGSDWPAVDNAHLQRIVTALCEAGRILRRGAPSRSSPA